MTKLRTLLPALFCAAALPLPAAPIELGLEPYGTVAWTGLDGQAVTGAGATLSAAITRGFSLTLSGESDNAQHSLVDRGVLGLRYSAAFGKRVTGDLGLGLGYDFERRGAFARIPIGLNFYAVKTKNADLGLRVAYALDVSGSAKRGTSDGRAFAGPVFNFRF
jgi:hypothetical protein